MFLDMTGKVALVSGGDHGLGPAIATVLLRHGAKVLAGSFGRDDGQACVSEHAAEHADSIAYVSLDVTRMADWQRAVALAEQRFGRLTTLINNAGSGIEQGVETTTDEGWQETIDLELKGSFLGTKACVPAMRRAGGGAIVNISSIYGIVASARGGTAYSAAKGGLVMLSKAAAVEYAPENIRVNSLHPGLFDGPRIRSLPPEWLNDAVGRTPLGRMADLIEIANAVLFLACDASSYVTGSSLVVDGGYVIV
jgi:cyclopentanol dehydrogenase